jgi:hypothetical protein
MSGPVEVQLCRVERIFTWAIFGSCFVLALADIQPLKKIRECNDSHCCNYYAAIWVIDFDYFC